MKDKIKAIIFDLGNVLVKIEYKFFLKNTKLDGIYTESEIYEILAEPAILYEKGIISSREFYQRAVKILSLKMDYEKFYFAWCSVISDVIDGMELVLNNLAKIYPLYLLSNTNEVHFDYVRNNFNILNYFNENFLSYKIGSIKPEKEIYEYVLKRVKLQPHEIFYIDDKLQNVLTAKELGIHSYQFVDSKKLNDLLKTKLSEK